MSFGSADSTMLTTPEAARLLGRPESTLKIALAQGKLAGVRTFAGWRIPADDLERWDRTTPRRNAPKRTAHGEETERILETFGPLTAKEVASHLGLHIGNARKQLAALARHQRAQRGADGTWVLARPDTREDANSAA